jgi:YVTN family beta-propeller protein
MNKGSSWLCRLCCPLLVAATVLGAGSARAAASNWQIFVSNEKSGDVSIIDGADLKVLATVPVGKRPRGIHVSPDGKSVYVALSGTPIEAPPHLDAQGNPIFQRGKNGGKEDDDDDAVNSDKSADGIGVLDVVQQKVTAKINAGSDPEEFALSKDGTRLYVSNEDTKTASVIDVASGKVDHIILVAQEPEGVGVTPDGKRFLVTCETGGEVFVIDAVNYQTIGHFKVDVRPRSVDFLAGSTVAFIPSESVGELNVVDLGNAKVIKTIVLPPGSRPMNVRVAPNGSRVYVSNGRAGTVSVIDGRTYELIDTVKVGTRPWGLAISPDGRYLYAANGPSNDISVVDLNTDKEISRVKVGSSPWGVTIVPAPRAH